MTVRFDRDLVPLTPALAVLAGVAVPRTYRRALAAVAAAWVAGHVQGDGPVAVESYGPWLDPSRYFLSDPAHHPQEVAAYRELMNRYRLAARFTAGSWIEVYVPRGTQVTAALRGAGPVAQWRFSRPALRPH